MWNVILSEFGLISCVICLLVVIKLFVMIDILVNVFVKLVMI